MTEPSAPPAPSPKGRWPLSTKWTIVVSVLTAGIGLLVLWSIYLFRGGNKKGGSAVAVGALVLFIVIASTGGSDKTKDDTSPNATPAPAATTTLSKPTPKPAAKPKPKLKAKATEPPGDNMNYRTRIYVKRMKTCTHFVGLFFGALQQPGSVDDITLADTIKSVGGLCDKVKENLASLDTKHFDDQAALGFYGIERIKSGFNALLEYVDTRAPSKLLEGRDKIQQGLTSYKQALSQINDRRAVYGLPPLK